METMSVAPTWAASCRFSSEKGVTRSAIFMWLETAHVSRRFPAGNSVATFQVTGHEQADTRGIQEHVHQPEDQGDEECGREGCPGRCRPQEEDIDEQRESRDDSRERENEEGRDAVLQVDAQADRGDEQVREE